MGGIVEIAKEKVRAWTVEGYDVSSLSSAIQSGGEAEVEDALAGLTSRIVRLKKAEESLKKDEVVLLASMDTGIFNEVREIRKIVRDPGRVGEAEAAVAKLMRSVHERKLGTRMSGLIDGLSAHMAGDAGRGERVSEIFVVYSDGRLLHHLSMEGNRSIDTDILSGMLTAIQDFVGHCLQYETGSFKKLEYGNLKVVVEQGKSIYIAYITSGAVTKDISKTLQAIVSKVEARYGEVLRVWDGDVSSLKGIGSIVKAASKGGE